jgi:hypothetical protein
MKLGLLAGASGLALGLGGVALLRAGDGPRPRPNRRSRRGMQAALSRTFEAARENRRSEGQPGSSPTETHPLDVPQVTRNFLMYFVLPIWLASGFADWLCHRETDIETTTGAKETFIHLLQLSEMGAATMAGLFLEITSPVLTLMILSFFAHEATALWDVSYAVKARNVTFIEQHVHSFLEMLPLMSLVMISALHWPQVLGLFGLEGHKPDWSIRLKKDPLPAGYIAAILGATVLTAWLPYLEELWRDWRAYPGCWMPPKARRLDEFSSIRQTGRK